MGKYIRTNRRKKFFFSFSRAFVFFFLSAFGFLQAKFNRMIWKIVVFAQVYKNKF